MTKLEEIARAICKGCGDEPDAIGDVPHSIYPRMDHAFPRWMSYLPAARSVVEGPLREPNPAMINAIRWRGSVWVVDEWKSMCDAILTEADKPDAPPV